MGSLNDEGWSSAMNDLTGHPVLDGQDSWLDAEMEGGSDNTIVSLEGEGDVHPPPQPGVVYEHPVSDAVHALHVEPSHLYPYDVATHLPLQFGN